MIDLGENEVVVSVTYGTQLDFGNVKVSATQTQVVNTEDVSPAAVRESIIRTLKDEIDPMAAEFHAEHKGELPTEEDEEETAVESEDEIETEDLSDDDSADDEEWMNPPSEQQSALSQEEIDAAAAELLED